MRRRTVGAIVCAGVVSAALAGYVVADVHDLVPGVLTLSEAASPAAAPDLPATDALAGPTFTRTDGAGVAASALAAPWSTFQRAASDGKWVAWASVLDAETGEVLLDSNQGARTPASTTKVLTAATALTTLDPAARLRTGTSLSGSDLHVWGEGDLLLARGDGDEDAINGRAGVADLARATAAALRERGVTEVKVHWQPTIFDGADRVGAWDAQGVGDYEGRVAPYAIDAGDLGVRRIGFTATPARDVAVELASRLTAEGIAAEVTTEESAPGDAVELAHVTSATIAEQVRWMLHHSDNTVADQLCRLAAGAAGVSTSPQGATENLVRTVNGLGIDTSAVRLDDCSGLSEADAIPATVLTETIRASLTAEHPDLATLVRSLPHVGVEGTVASRMEDSAADGNAMAKSGSLSTVSALAGVVSTSSGRTLVFAVGSDDVPDDGAYWTRPAIDDFVEALAGL